MNIYISNLNFATKDESLRNLFAGYGDVSSANIITDRETGRSRGFGFVEMPDETQGRSAIDALNETEFEGKVGREPGGDGKNRHHRASPPEAGRTSRRQRPSQVAAHAPPGSVCTSKYPIFGTASSESSAFTVPA